MATTKINWKELYNDLPTHLAEALRAARLKPEQLINKTDGELMAIEGVKEEDLDAIRAIYTADSVKAAPVAAIEADETISEATPVEEVKATRLKATHRRSARYQRLRKEVSKDTLFSIADAVTKITTLSRGSKLKTVELTVNVKEAGLRGEIKLPHSTGKEIKIAIFNDEVANKISNGQIDFDMLLATPADMPKLARFAKVLGPRGIMPNPRNGTVTPDPEKRAAELAAGGTLPYKTEGKFPIIHLALGPITQNQQDLIDNLTETLRSIGVSKIRSAFLSCTQTPSVKLSVGTL